MSNTTSSSRLYEAYSTHTPAVVRGLFHEALRHFTAAAAATVTVILALAAIGSGDYTAGLDFGTRFAEIPEVVVPFLGFVLVVATLSLVRGYARQTGRSVLTASLATALAYTTVMAVTGTEPTQAPSWILYPIAFVVLGALFIPSVGVAAWVLGATRRPEAA